MPGLGDTAYAQSIDLRHETRARNLPKASEDLWESLTEFVSDRRFPARVVEPCAYDKANARVRG